MAHLLTLEGDTEAVPNAQQFIDALANQLSGDVPEGFEPVEIHGDFHVTYETDDTLYGDAVIHSVLCQGPAGLNGELGKFSLKMKSPFKMKGFKMPKMPKFKGIKLGKIKMPFKMNLKKMADFGLKPLKALGKGYKGLAKGLSKFGSKVGDVLSQGASGLMDMASGMMPGMMPGGEQQAPEEEQGEAAPEEMMQEQYPQQYQQQQYYPQEQQSYMPYNEPAQEDPGAQMAQEFGPAWFDAADEMAGELGKKKSGKNKMLGVNLLAIASGNPELMRMAALANVSQAQRNQAAREKKRQQTQGLLKAGLSIGAGVLTGGAALPGMLPGLSGMLGSGGLGALTSALGPLGSSLGGITKTLGITGLKDFAGLMGPGGISQIASKLGSGGLGDLLSKLGPDAAKLATSEGAKRLVQSLSRSNNSQDLFNMLRSQLAPVTPPPPESATIENDQVTFSRPREMNVSGSVSASNGPILILAVGALVLLSKKGRS
jgi:hypothetical protein